VIRWGKWLQGFTLLVQLFPIVKDTGNGKTDPCRKNLRVSFSDKIYPRKNPKKYKNIFTRTRNNKKKLFCVRFRGIEAKLLQCNFFPVTVGQYFPMQ
jgi:hypothetical protein